MAKTIRTLSLFAVLAFAALPVRAEVAAPAKLGNGESVAHLEKTLATPTSMVIDGRVWQCSADACYAAHQDGAVSQPLRYECENAAQALGAFRDYQTGGWVMTQAQLDACNAKARR